MTDGTAGTARSDAAPGKASGSDRIAQSATTKQPHLVMQESAEMYLETILVLQDEGKNVRSIDIANRMEHSRATVSEWMKKLSTGGYVTVAAHGIISLTSKGRGIASHVYERHLLLTDLFESLGVNEKTAAEDACRVEHYISDETFDCLRSHYQKHQDRQG